MAGHRLKPQRGEALRPGEISKSRKFEASCAILRVEAAVETETAGAAAVTAKARRWLASDSREWYREECGAFDVVDTGGAVSGNLLMVHSACLILPGWKSIGE